MDVRRRASSALAWAQQARFAARALPFVLAILLIVWSGSQGAGAEEKGVPDILVGLAKASGAVISSASQLSVIGVTGGKPSSPAVLPRGASVAISISPSGVCWESSHAGEAQSGLSEGPLLVSPVEAAGPQALDTSFCLASLRGGTSGLVGSSFRGSLIAVPASGQLVLTNVVGFEDYVGSVVGAEMPSGWPSQSLEAQAVAIRTYAAYKMGFRSASDIPDYIGDFGQIQPGNVLLWASDPVYRGISKETPASKQAAASTRGQVLMYGGSPIAAFFHSDAGGMTEDPRYVWGRPIPYLQPVLEVPHESPHSSWTCVLSWEDLASGLSGLGVDVDEAVDILEGCEPGPSGRWSGIRVETKDGPAAVTATAFRGAFPGVRSMLFSSYAYGGGGETKAQISPNMDVFVAGSDGRTTSTRLSSCAAEGGRNARTEDLRGAFVLARRMESQASPYVIQGMGWGHGVGHSQYGAAAMAESGYDAQAILRLYYPGTDLVRWWQ